MKFIRFFPKLDNLKMKIKSFIIYQLSYIMLKKIFFLFVLLFINSQVTFFGQSSNFKHSLLLENITDESQLVISLNNNEDVNTYLRRNEFRIKSSTKNWIFLTINGKQLKNILNSSISKYLYTETNEPTNNNDTSRVYHKVDEVQKGLKGLQSKFKGKGVLLGVIDNGMDYTHLDFKDSLGKTRLHSYWDQTNTKSTSRSPQPFNYGDEWTSTDLDNNLFTPTLTDGHGTHVPGIAAGNGRANGRNLGMAPEATIIYVQTNTKAKNWTLTVSDACDYIFKIADKLNMPCVINISFGVANGSHDGSDPASELIEKMLDAKPGRIVVAAAGNSGNLTKYHLGNNVNSDTSFFWLKNNASGVAGKNSIWFESWADSVDYANIKFSVAANLPGGDYQLRSKTKFITFQDALAYPYTDTLFNENGVKIGKVEYYGSMQNHLANMELAIYVDSTNYLYQFRTTGQGRLDCWTLGTSTKNNEIVSTTPSSLIYPAIIHYVLPDSLQTVYSSYISSEKVITVGNVSTKSSYITKDLVSHPSVYLPSQIHVSSSKGPNRKGVIKPDIVASGTKIFSANPAKYLTDPNNITILDIGGSHILNSGTSMASPLVAGVAALYLEKCSNASYLDFKNDMISTAKTLAIQGSMPNNAYGNGEIDALALLLKTNAKPSLSGNTMITCNNVAAVTIGSDRGVTSIVWGDQDTKTSKSFLTAGKYAYQITDAKNCIFKDTVNISKAPDLATTINYIGDSILTCKNKSVSLYATGGVSYVWSGGNIVMNDTVTFNHAGKYTLTTTDVNGCSKIDTIQIKNTSLLSSIKFSFQGDSVFNCKNKTVKVIIPNVSSILWSAGTDVTNDTNQFNHPGTYFVSISDSNGCSIMDSITILQDTVQPKLSFAFIGDSVITCSTKSILVKSNGGTSYTWSGGQTISNDTNKFTLPGTYICTSIGVNGCQKKDSLLLISDTIKPTLTIGFVGDSKISCSNKKVLVSVKGALNYLWDDGTSPLKDTNEFSTSGNFYVLGTSSNGCTSKDSIAIQLDTVSPSIKTSFIGTSIITCVNKMVTSVASGGVSYKWFAGTQALKDTNVFSEPGTYNVEVTGVNGCVSNKNITITQDTVSPTLTLSAPKGFSLNCAKPSVTLFVSGANSYLWKGGLSTKLDSSVYVQGGKYSVNGVGTNGCITTKSFQVIADTSKPKVILQYQGDSIITCVNKSVRVSMLGAQSYSWYGGVVFSNNVQEFTKDGNYQLISTGYNSCQNTQTIQIFKDTLLPVISKTFGSPSTITCSNKLVQVTINGASVVQWDGGKMPMNPINQFDMPGIYHFIANNNNGCLLNDSIEVLSDTLPAKSMIKMIGQNQLTCSNKRVLVQATGGVSYTWNGGASIQTDTNSFIIPGDYLVSIVDSKGCHSVQNVLIKQDVLQPTLSINLLSSTYINCDNDPVKVKIVGAKSYVWNGGKYLLSDTNTFINEGKYIVTATGQNGCVVKDSIVVDRHSYPATPTITQKDSLLIASSSPNYQWYVDGDLLVNETKQNIVYKLGSTYFVSVESNGCISTSKFYTPTLSGITQVSLSPINVYPNPTKGRITIQGVQEGDQLQFLDLLGNKVSLTTLGMNDYQLESLADGVYFLAIDRNSKRMLVKIVKN